MQIDQKIQNKNNGKTKIKFNEKKKEKFVPKH